MLLIHVPLEGDVSPLSSLQNGGGLGVTFLSLPVTSSLILFPRNKNNLFDGDIGERLTSIGPHYLGEKAKAWKRQCLPVTLEISIC